MCVRDKGLGIHITLYLTYMRLGKPKNNTFGINCKVLMNCNTIQDVVKTVRKTEHHNYWSSHMSLLVTLDSNNNFNSARSIDMLWGTWNTFHINCVSSVNYWFTPGRTMPCCMIRLRVSGEFLSHPEQLRDRFWSLTSRIPASLAGPMLALITITSIELASLSLPWWDEEASGGWEIMACSLVFTNRYHVITHFSHTQFVTFVTTAEQPTEYKYNFFSARSTH